VKYVFFQLYDTTDGHTSIHNSKREAADRALKFHQETCDEFEVSSHEPKDCLSDLRHLKLGKCLGMYLESEDEIFYASDSYCAYSIFIRPLSE
jgi:hypothetical protein